MSFVFEVIPEADKQRIDFSKIKIGFRPLKPYQWAVDRTIDAFLVWHSTDRDPPHLERYVFRKNGKVYEVAVSESGEKSSGGWLYVWKIKEILIPKGMTAPSREVDDDVMFIENALEVTALKRSPTIKIANVRIEQDWRKV